MNRLSGAFVFTLVCFILMTGCSNDKKPAVPAVAIKRSTVMDPFKYHKRIEVVPGQDYDILSWGRGSVKSGAFLILHSDSSSQKYTTTTGDLDGAITDVYNSDMDMDGNPEILIQVKGKDTANFTHIIAFEFNGSKAQKLEFPKLTKSQRDGYRGDDNFYIKDGKFIREFPVYDGTGNGAKTTGEKRKLEYGLRNNNFTVTQLTADSTHTKKIAGVNRAAANTANTEKKHKTAPAERSTSKKKTKHSREKKRKKKHHRRRHHSDEE